MARFCQHQDTRKQMMMRANPPTTTTSDPFGGRVQKLVLEPVQHPAHHLSLERLAPALRLEQKEKVSVPMSRLNRDGNARSLGWLLCSAPRLNWLAALLRSAPQLGSPLDSLGELHSPPSWLLLESGGNAFFEEIPYRSATHETRDLQLWLVHCGMDTSFGCRWL